MSAPRMPAMLQPRALPELPPPHQTEPSRPMRHVMLPVLLRLRARLFPGQEALGWMPFYHLGYLAFLFLPVVLALLGQGGPWLGGSIEHIFWPAVLSVPPFLLLYVAAYRSEGVLRDACMVLMGVLACALLPFNTFANTYTIYACGFAAKRGRPVWAGLGWMALSLSMLLATVLWLGYPVFVFFITLIVAVAVFFANHHFLEITRKRAELSLSHEEVRRLAQTAERERIGRDLHDLLGHTLSLVALKSDLAGKLLARGDGSDARAAEARAAAQREIAEVSRVAREALAQVRSAVTGIRAAGIAAELVSAKLLLETDGVAFASQVDPRWLEGGALPDEVERALAMTVREAMTNIQRHARARNASVELETIGGEAVLRIVDDGRGGAIVPGNGLDGMRERIEAVGGTLRIDSTPGQGTRVLMQVPAS